MALVFVGTYTETRSQGIFVFHFDDHSGTLTQIGSVDAGPNPSYLALHPKLPLLYAVNEVGSGFVTAVPIGSGGVLESPLPGKRQSTHGNSPCWVSIHPSRQHLLTANYTEGDGSVCVLPLSPVGEPLGNTDFVRLGVPAQKSCAHCLVASPDGRCVLAADIKQNRIFIYDFDAAHGKLTPHAALPFLSLPGSSPQLLEGAGPRHLVFSPDGRFLYCVNEYASTLTVFAWNEKNKTAAEIQTISLLPEGFTGKSAAAAVHFSPNGRFLYASNRGHDSLAVFAVDRKTGRLDVRGHVPTHGSHPRDFNFSPSGAFLIAANKDTNNLVVFRANDRTGELIPTGQEVSLPRPVCVIPTAAKY